MKKRLKNSKAITLVALVITIIILLILAGISIATLTGSGLFEKVIIAKEETEEVQKSEEQKLLNYSQKIEDVVKGNREDIKNDFEISTPYIGTSSVTIKIDIETIDINIKKYIYVAGNVVVESDKTEETLENLQEDSNIDITVIAVTVGNNHLISTKTIKTLPRVYLYNSGDQCISITGGYTSVERTGKTFSATFNEADVYINCYGNAGGGGIVTNNMIDLTEYKYLKAYGNLEKYAYSDSIGRILSISTSKTWGESARPTGYNALATTGLTVGTDILTCDISEKIGDFYIWNGFNQSRGYIYSVWLEK